MTGQEADYACQRCKRSNVPGVAECEVLVDVERYYVAWLCEPCRSELDRIGTPPHFTGRTKGSVA